MGANQKLFRAIVIMGASLTASACFDPGSPPCAKCAPVDASPDTVAVRDAPGSDAEGYDAGVPNDAVVDTVLIL